jgi:hypothetical protein
MAKESQFGLGKDAYDDNKRHEAMISLLERQENDRRNDLRITVEQLSKKQQALAAEHQQLQQLLIKEEGDLKNLQQPGETRK